MEQHPTKQVLGEGKYLRLVHQAGWEYAERKNVSGVVVIVPVTSDRRIVLVEQRRLAVAASVIELPAGLAGDIADEADESLATAAARELVEETGYVAGKMKFLTTGPPSAGLGDEVTSFFLATELKKVSTGGGDETENIQVHEIPLSEVHDWLEEQRRQGKQLDVKIYAGLYFVGRAMK